MGLSQLGPCATKLHIWGSQKIMTNLVCLSDRELLGTDPQTHRAIEDQVSCLNVFTSQLSLVSTSWGLVTLIHHPQKHMYKYTIYIGVGISSTKSWGLGPLESDCASQIFLVNMEACKYQPGSFSML